MSYLYENSQLFMDPTIKQYGNHMVMTDVHKPLKRKYVNIDTKFRDEYDSTGVANYNITLPEKLTNVKSIMVCSAEIPLTYFNISSAIGNNAMKIVYGASSEILVVRDGEYTSTTLATEINSQLDQMSSPFSNITFDVSGYFSEFKTNTGNYNYTYEFYVDSSGNFDKYNIKSKLGWTLGYRNPTYDNSGTLFSESIIDLNGPRYLYLALDDFNRGSQNSFMIPSHTSLLSKNIIARIATNDNSYSFGKILPANNFNGYLLTDRRMYSGKVDILKLNIQLLDENGKPVNLNGIDFSICLEIEHE